MPISYFLLEIYIFIWMALQKTIQLVEKKTAWSEEVSMCICDEKYLKMSQLSLTDDTGALVGNLF